jgi:hypothetical protein
MLQTRNSVAFFYRFRLTSPRFLHSLSSNKASRVSVLASKARSIGIACIGLALLAACATVESRPATEVVKERAQARWNALVSGDAKAAYAYFTPATRKTLKPEDYASSIKKGFWKSVTVDRVECASADLCTADSTVVYEHRLGRVKTPLRETWIREGQNWWYALKE